MTIDQYAGLLMRVTYKPGWRLTVREAAGGHAVLEIQFETPDTWPPHNPRTIAMSYTFHLGEWVNARRFYKFVRASVLRSEEHEANEWFRIDGVSWPTADHATF